MNKHDTREYYLAFISIVFGIFIAVWAQPLIDALKPDKFTAVSQSSSPASLGQNDRGLENERWGKLKGIGSLELAQGGLTLLIIVCLWWWYGVFLRAFAPAQGFFMYLYDFLSLGSFAVAAGIWRDNHGNFAFVVLVASLAVGLRFFSARKKTKRFNRARRALEWGTWTVVVLVALGAMLNLGYVLGQGKGKQPLVDETKLSLFLIVVMLTGVGVTLAAVYMTEGIGWGRDFVLDVAMDRLIDPFLSPVRTWKTTESRVLENRCQAAMREFEEKCVDSDLYTTGDATSSEVHSPNDLHCQAKLAVYASDGTFESISKRVQMMYFVHWFDDLVDQRGALAVHLCKLGSPDYDSIFSADRHLARAKILADYYRSLCHQEYFDTGLIRLIYGARLFKGDQNGFLRVLREKHVKLLKNRGVGDESLREAPKFIDLTVKTAVEFWFGMDHQPMSYDYSFLYSLLYGPGLYHHDLSAEKKAGEHNSEWGDLNDAETAEMIRKVGKRIESKIRGDPKAPARAQEVFHFVLCFGDVVPTKVKAAYDDVAGDLLSAVDSTFQEAQTVRDVQQI